MYLIEKLKDHGFLWFFRRIMREFVVPTTSFGKKINFLSPLIYSCVNQPINFLMTLKRTKTFDDTLLFFYDFEVEPITYDFFWALCAANVRRKRHGLNHLLVVFVPGLFNSLRKESIEYEQVVDFDARHWRIQSILLPAIQLLSCRTSIMFCNSRSEAENIRNDSPRFFYPDKYNVTFPVPYSFGEVAQHSEEFMAIRADNQALKYVSGWLQRVTNGKRTIVITLRQYNYVPERNSNISEWVLF